MEQKKILWIVAAVGFFLLVIIGTALILYTPQSASEPAMASVQPQNDVWFKPTTETLSNDQVASAQKGAMPPLSATTTPDAIAPDGTVPAVPSTNLPANTLQANDLTVFSSGNTTIFSADGVTTIDLTAGKTANANIAQQPQTSTPAKKAVTPVTTRVPSTTSTAPKPSSSASSTPVAKMAPKTAVQPAPTPKAPVDQYWVQAASFTSKPNAESARKILIAEKIPAEVFTYDDKTGITYYRLRVGPYTTESEAVYWNTRIKLIDEFAKTQSYVTNSSKPKT